MIQELRALRAEVTANHVGSVVAQAALPACSLACLHRRGYLQCSLSFVALMVRFRLSASDIHDGSRMLCCADPGMLHVFTCQGTFVGHQVRWAS